MPEDTLPSFPRDTMEVELADNTGARRIHVLHVLEGNHAGLIFTFETDVVTIGRGELCELSLGDAGVSRTHASFARTVVGVELRDLDSRNGTFVNGRRALRAVLLRHGDMIGIGGVRLRYGFEAEEHVVRMRDLHDAAVRDHLTRLYNRRFFDERLVAEVAYAVRHEAPLALLMFDVDRFKQINDTYGHMAGDVALRAVAAVLESGVRTEDLVARYGGEEFVVLARGAGIEGALALAERLRERVQALSLQHDGRSISLRVSGGAVALSDRIATSRNLLRAVDNALYQAKDQGRNRIIAASADDVIDRTSEMEPLPTSHFFTGERGSK